MTNSHSTPSFRPCSLHELPVGAVVIYSDGDRRAKLVVVQHAQDCDGSPLYMAAEWPVSPPPDQYKFFSMGYMMYRVLAGWFVGNVSAKQLKDTGDRVEVTPFIETDEAASCKRFFSVSFHSLGREELKPEPQKKKP